MFQWDKSINAINLPATKVLNLFRSMREVQLALPGIPSQQASAYLCQFQAENGVETVAAFHMHKSQVLAFYFSDPRIVPEQKADNMFDQGLNFVESMGFLLTDQDIHLLDVADQEMLWASLPLKSGLQIEEEKEPVVTPAKKVIEKPVVKVEATKEQKQAPATVAVSPPVVKEAVAVAPVKVAPVKVAPKVEPEPDATENVDDLLAAVEAMRAKRPGLRARKSLPTAEDLEKRRLQLRETVGRILASL